MRKGSIMGEMVDIKEAAKIVGVSGARMRQLAIAGSIRAKKFGNAWAFDEDDVVAYRDSPRKVGRPKKTVTVVE